MMEWRKPVFLILLGVLVSVCVLPFVAVNFVDKIVAGLSLNIIGSIILAIFGIPQPDFSTRIMLALDLPDEEKELSNTQHKKRTWHMACSYLGIVCLVLGFLFQLWNYLEGDVQI